MSLAHTHTLSSIQCWKAQFVRTPCDLALSRFVNNIQRVGAGGRLKQGVRVETRWQWLMATMSVRIAEDRSDPAISNKPEN